MLPNNAANSFSLFFVSFLASFFTFFAVFFAVFVAVLVTPTALVTGAVTIPSKAFANPLIDIAFLDAIRADLLVGCVPVILALAPARGVRCRDRLCLVRRLVRLWDLCFVIIY